MGCLVAALCERRCAWEAIVFAMALALALQPRGKFATVTDRRYRSMRMECLVAALCERRCAWRAIVFAMALALAFQPRGKFATVAAAPLQVDANGVPCSGAL